MSHDVTYAEKTASFASKSPMSKVSSKARLISERISDTSISIVQSSKSYIKVGVSVGPQ